MNGGRGMVKSDEKRTACAALLVAAALVAVPASAWAETHGSGGEPPAQPGWVEGLVVDSESGTPVVGAVVRLAELGRGDVTHEDGEFHLNRIPAGRYSLVVERPGYAPETRRITVIAGDTVRLRIELRPSALHLPALVVTGTVSPSAREDLLRPTNVLSGERLARQIDGTVAGTLEGEAGIASASMGPATARPVIRGLGGDRILLLEDGERTGDLSSTAPDHAVAIDPISARRVEVVRGPAALLYGSSALGGVVNVVREEIPLSIPDRTTGDLALQGQSATRSLAAAASVLAHVTGPVALRAEGTYRETGDVHTPTGPLANTDVRTYGGALGTTWVNGWGHAGLSYRLFDSSYGVPGGFVGGHQDGVAVEMRRHALRGQGRLLAGLGPFSSVHADVGYTEYYHREVEYGGVLGTEFGLLTGSGELIARHESLGPFAAGAVGVRGEWRDFAAGGSIDMPPAEEFSGAVFALEELDLGRLRVQLGGRYDVRQVVAGNGAALAAAPRRAFAATSGSLGALYRLAEGVTAGATLARAFRTPDANELYSRGPHLAAYTFEIGNAELRAETGLGMDLFARLARASAHGEIAVFRNRIGDFIYPRHTGGISRTGLPIYQFTNADALLQGFEASGAWSVLNHVVLDGVVSHVRGTNLSEDRPLPLIPPLAGGVSLRHERRSHFVQLGWRGAAAQERLGEFEEATAGYALLNASAGYNWAALGRAHSLTLRVDNLTDTEYRNHLSRVKAIMPEPGRSVNLLYRLIF
jgi:iron complex outermembrane recepter protein